MVKKLSFVYNFKTLDKYAVKKLHITTLALKSPGTQLLVFGWLKDSKIKHSI